MNDKLKDVPSKKEHPSNNARRDFLNKYGKLAAITPVAVTALFSPETSAAPKSCKGNNSNKFCP